MKTILAFVLAGLMAWAPLGASPMFFGLGYTASGGVSYLVSQDFESGSASPPTGWSNQGGTTTWNYTPAIVGSYSLQVSAASGEADTPTFAGQSSFDEFFAFSCSNVTAGALIADAYGSSAACYRVTVSGGQIYLKDSNDSNLTTLSSYPLSINTRYYVWVSYIKGTGSNAVMTIGISTSLGTRPVSGTGYGSLSVGNSTQNAVQADFYSTSTNSVIVDYVRCKTTAGSIGGTP